MREIKFRGKRVDNGEWVYGYYLPVDQVQSNIAVYGMHDYEVIPVFATTVGQYTGLEDKNGVEIYEGDIVDVCISEPDGYPIMYKITIKSIFDYDALNHLNHANEIEVIGNELEVENES